ncbi:hypothetical protein N7478_011329 [Penicillium angulare]|uniref:uncharacterized protein n=1 Tax=Penicillium angulare TaxID=116970 RepID=UPI00254067F6|nr:uncharacterized protein N7478_011329 [Penicillium angulare]KAJ5263724.1 hypothetical protein N7478_011329 [Penicillium angulare]
MDSPMNLTQPEKDEPQIECWDDDDDLQFNEGVQFGAASSTGSVTNSSFRPSGHRDSISSRRSARSDLDSNAGDEDWQVPLHDSDDFAKEEALASAKRAGIPIPANIPSSALLGGAIKRLSNRKSKRTFVDDWTEDVELPGPEFILKLRNSQHATFPDTIRQISSTVTSPVKSTASSNWNEDVSTRLQSALTGLDRIQDENDEPINQYVPILKAPTPRSPQKPPTRVPAGDLLGTQESDDFDQDLELPPDHQPLQLSHRKDTTRSTSPTFDDFDLEWSEGSIGVRVGGTARDGRSIPSSSISIASPSVSSCITGESDDGLDGLVFPDGPLDFSASLKRREEESPSEHARKGKELPRASESMDADDFFAGLDVDNGRAFAQRKLNLNPNVKCKTEWPSSPTRRSATTLTFTNPGASATSTTGSPRQFTRIPRLSGHEATLSSNLETVSESGAPISKFQRPQSRLGHSSQSSISSLPASATNSASPNPTPPSRRLLGPRAARNPAPAGNAPTPARLRTKRSLPSIRGTATATTAASLQRTPSHTDGHVRPSAVRPKTPVERTSFSDSRPSAPRVQPTFISATASERQPHHSSIKIYRPSRRQSSDGSSSLLSPQQTSLPSRSNRPNSFRLSLDDSRSETISSTAKRTLTRPTRRRNFGDGTELESFDDLPTSVSAESKFTKNPAGRGVPRPGQARLSQSRINSISEPPTQITTPPSISKPLNSTPRFARDTNASRNAREQRIASINSRNRDASSLGSFNSNWKPNPISRISPNAAPIRSRKSKSTTKSQSKPQLIKPMGAGMQEPKFVRGMRYNPNTFLWEGNENFGQEFDVATAPKSPKPALALISNVGNVNNVQTVGGMVFDPQRMCWLRASPRDSRQQGRLVPEDEDDVFAGLDDLEDKAVGTKWTTKSPDDTSQPHVTGEEPSAGESSDEGPITEEFDVGPEFIRRQRAEEEKWRRKVNKWVGFNREDRNTHWRWAIRDLMTDGMTDPMVKQVVSYPTEIHDC